MLTCITVAETSPLQCASGRRTGLSLSHARVLRPALGLWVYISIPAKRVRVIVGPCLQHLFCADVPYLALSLVNKQII